MDKFLTLLTLGIVRFVYVNEGTNQVVVRFGKFVRVLPPGLQAFLSLWGFWGTIFKFTITDLEDENQSVIHTKEVNTKEVVYGPPKESVISSDNVQFNMSVLFRFRVKDSYKVLFNVTDYTASLRGLLLGMLRAVIGRYTLEEIYSKRREISAELTQAADQATEEWGIKVLGVEIKDMDLGEFTEQLRKQKSQDIEKREQILNAEGEAGAIVKIAEARRTSQLLEAEGEKLAAEAKAEAIKTKAAAEAEAKRMTYEAEAYGYRIKAEQLQATPEMKQILQFTTAVQVSEKLAMGGAKPIFISNGMDQIVGALALFADTLHLGKSEPKIGGSNSTGTNGFAGNSTPQKLQTMG